MTATSSILNTSAADARFVAGPSIDLPAAPWMAEVDRKWHETRARFLAAVVDDQRAAVEARLNDFGNAGAGLRNWLAAIAWRGAVLPPLLPRALVQVYLDDEEARPLHECEDCGLSIPVRPGQRQSSAARPERVYFEVCPDCVGLTGWYVFRTKAAGWQNWLWEKSLPAKRNSR